MEKFNLVEIFKDSKESDKIELWSPVWGKCWFVEIHSRQNNQPMIKVKLKNGECRNVTPTGRLGYSLENLGNCILWPSEENQNWKDYNPIWEPQYGDRYYYIAIVGIENLEIYSGIYTHGEDIPSKVFKNIEKASEFKEDLLKTFEQRYSMKTLEDMMKINRCIDFSKD